MLSEYNFISSVVIEFSVLKFSNIGLIELIFLISLNNPIIT